MKNDYLNLPAKSNGETIREHTDKLIKDLDDFKEDYSKYFSESELKEIYYACEYHDYGKCVFVFQKRIGNDKLMQSTDNDKKKIILNMYREIGCERNIPHGFISPMFISRQLSKEMQSELGEESLCRIVSAIYYHHNRKDISKLSLKRVCTEDLKLRFPDIKFNRSIYDFKYGDTNNSIYDNDECWVSFAITLGMLNKFDYHASDE